MPCTHGSRVTHAPDAVQSSKLTLRQSPLPCQTHLFAALEVATGKVTHEAANSHTAADFVAFMKKVVRKHPGQELHVILDNSATHRTDDVRAWLAKNPLVYFHDTPTSASWLNEVEGFFGILAKQSPSLTDFPTTTTLGPLRQEPFWA